MQAPGRKSRKNDTEELLKGIGGEGANRSDSNSCTHPSAVLRDMDIDKPSIRKETTRTLPTGTPVPSRMTLSLGY